MKILFLIDSLGSGGAQRQMVTLATLLKEQRRDVSLLLYEDDGFFQNEVKKLNIPIHYILTQSYAQRIWHVRKHIRNGKYDAIISFLDTPNFLNNFAAIGGSWKVITSERSSKEDFLISKRGKIFAWFQRFSDAIVCNSHNAKIMWEKHYPKYSDKLSVIYNPVLLPEITSEYQIKREGKLHIIVAASYQYLKNPIGVIKALALMSKEERAMVHIDWYGRKEVTLGNTAAYDEAVKLIEVNNLIEVISLNDPTHDIANKMNEADAVALFSELEGLPNAICEGMMIGKPIIMTKVSDYNTLVDVRNGVLCDWDNPVSIKDAILSIAKLNNKGLIEMGNQSKQKADGLFSAETIIKNWIELIKS